MVERSFQRVVARVCNCPLQFDTSKRRAELRPRALFIKWSASWSKAQAQRRIGRIGLVKHQKVMRRRAHVADSSQRGRSHLPFDARHPMLGIYGNVDWSQFEPLVGIPAVAAGAIRYVLHWKSLPRIRARRRDG